METDKNKIKLIMDEPYKTFQPKEIVKLPCGHGNVEITNFGDQYLECSQCHKKWLMVNNQHGSKKLYV